MTFLRRYGFHKKPRSETGRRRQRPSDADQSAGARAGELAIRVYGGVLYRGRMRGSEKNMPKYCVIGGMTDARRSERVFGSLEDLSLLWLRTGSGERQDPVYCQIVPALQKNMPKSASSAV